MIIRFASFFFAFGILAAAACSSGDDSTPDAASDNALQDAHHQDGVPDTLAELPWDQTQPEEATEPQQDSNTEIDSNQPLVCSARSNGATGDGKTSDTAAIQAAIDQCGDKGGVVVVEAGTYVSGTLFLRSNMTLRLEEGATILGSTAPEEYPKHHLIYGKDLENLVIEGPGTIDGNGPYWWVARMLAGFRPHPMIRLITVDKLEIRNIFITQSPGWHLHVVDSENVYIHHVKIRSDVDDNSASPNTDGIDIDASRYVEVAHCDIECGDDAIVLKSDGTGEFTLKPMHDILVHDCVLASWANALKIGTRPEAEVRDVIFRDCLVQASVDHNPGTRAMGGVTLIADAGADVHNILAENIHMTAVESPFFLRVQERKLDDGTLTLPGRLYDITLRNITVDDCTYPALIMGVPEHKVENVTLENITIVSSEGGTSADALIEPPERNFEYPDAWYFGKFPAYGLYMRHVSGPVTLKEPVTLTSSAEIEERPAVMYWDVQQLDLSGLAEGTTVVEKTPEEP